MMVHLCLIPKDDSFSTLLIGFSQALKVPSTMALTELTHFRLITPKQKVPALNRATLHFFSIAPNAPDERGGNGIMA